MRGAAGWEDRGEAERGSRGGLHVAEGATCLEPGTKGRFAGGAPESTRLPATG